MENLVIATNVACSSLCHSRSRYCGSGSRGDPSYFLDQFDGQTIIDEIQHAPSLLRELKICIDKFMWLAFVVVEKIMIFVGGSAIAGFLLICLILFAAVV